MDVFLAVLFAYLLGSVPTGLLAGKLAKGIDIRTMGSGKTGATNVLRAVGPRWFAAVLAADVAKGVAAVAIARALAETDAADLGAGLAVVAGHNWPLYVGFRGGRGVLTSTGVLAMIAPLAFGAALGVSLAVIAVTRYVSAGSVLGAVTVIVFMSIAFITDHASGYHTAFALLGAVTVIAAHHDNIRRLLAGTERRLGQHAEKREPAR